MVRMLSLMGGDRKRNALLSGVVLVARGAR